MLIFTDVSTYQTKYKQLISCNIFWLLLHAQSQYSGFEIICFITLVVRDFIFVECLNYNTINVSTTFLAFCIYLVDLLIFFLSLITYLALQHREDKHRQTEEQIIPWFKPNFHPSSQRRLYIQMVLFTEYVYIKNNRLTETKLENLQWWHYENEKHQTQYLFCT